MAAETYAVRHQDRLVVLGHVRGQAPALAGFALSAGVAAASGGYFPAAWGVTSLALLALAAAMLCGHPPRLSRADVLWTTAFSALLGWTALSATWSASVPQTMLEVERTLVYAAGALALVLVARGEHVARLLGGALAGTTAVAAYALATRLFPDRFHVEDTLAGNRLAAPLGYWNGLGIYCAIGVLLAVGLAARGRVLPAAALPLLTTALFFTFSRGAWAALALGLAAMLALTHQRLRLIGTLAALAPASAAAVLLAARERALTHTGAAAGAAAREGHRLVPVLVLLVVGSALSLHAARFFQRRRVAIASIAISIAGAAALAAGTSWSTAKPAAHGDLNHRVTSVSTNGRTTLWRLALADAGSHPLLGSGAGTYEQYFLRHRGTPALTVRDAHSLYLETLAELGPIGLALLALGLALPLAGAVRARRDGLAVAAAGAYVAFLAHAAWDWDWELPAVTLLGLVAGAVLLGRARASARPAGRGRFVLAALLVVPAAFAAATLAGNRSASAARDAAATGNWGRVAAKAHRATRLTPWSPEPWQAIAQSRLANGDFAGARAALDHALKLDPGNWQLWLDLSVATEGSAHAAALDRARALNPFDPDFSR